MMMFVTRKTLSFSREAKKKGFTLIEILISILILGLVISVVYVAYMGTLRLVEDMDYEREVYSMGRQTLGRMIRDLSVVSRDGFGLQFKCRKEHVAGRDFQKVTFKATSDVLPGDELQSRIVEVTYHIIEGEGDRYNLLRSDHMFVDKEEKGSNDGVEFILCNNLKYMEMLLVDRRGEKHETWDSSSNLPEQKGQTPSMVLIRLGFFNRKNPDDVYPFFTAVCIPLSRVVDENIE